MRATQRTAQPAGRLTQRPGAGRLGRHRGRFTVAVAAAVLVLVGVTAQRAAAQTYPDVPKKHWARAHIGWVTDQLIDGRRLLDDYGPKAFKPDRPITRAQMARALALACRRQDRAFTPVALSDVPVDHPYYRDIQIVLKLHLMSATAGAFRPDDPCRVWQADRSIVLMLKLLYPRNDWSMLTALDPRNWRPNSGWTTPAPRFFPFEVAARYLGLRYNHPSIEDGQELSPTEPIGRDEVAYSLHQALTVSAWKVSSLSRFDTVKLPPLSDRQKEIVAFALSYAGHPFVYGGEFPTPDSPYGHQAHGGFDCSGFDWWVMKIHFQYPISVYQRTAAAMAAAAKPRITRAKLKPCDLIFFAPAGPRSAASTVYHAALYLGNGWFIHSTGSTDGVSIASLDWKGWGWHTDLWGGRRLLKAAELLLPTPTPTPSPTPTPTQSPSPSPSPQ